MGAKPNSRPEQHRVGDRVTLPAGQSTGHSRAVAWATRGAAAESVVIDE